MMINNILESSEEKDILNNLNSVSYNMGLNKKLVQGPGGNNSVKLGGKLIVKASGKRLNNAKKENIFIPLDLSNVLEIFQNYNESNKTLEFRPLIDTNLKPSIETFLHALMPFNVVLHSHPVDIIASTVLDDFRNHFKFLLNDFIWDFIPYCRPGYPLAYAIKKSLSKQKSNVLFLANHGMIIGANTITEAEKIQRNILERFKIMPRKVSKPNFNFLQKLLNRIPNSKLPESDIVHSLACDSNSLYLSKKRPLYPDHVVFCGVKPKILEKEEINPDNINGYPYIIVPKLGVILLTQKSDLLEIMLEMQAEIFLRLDISRKINFLSDKDCKDLINWDAEEYRQKMDN